MTPIKAGVKCAIYCTLLHSFNGPSQMLLFAIINMLVRLEHDILFIKQRKWNTCSFNLHTIIYNVIGDIKFLLGTFLLENGWAVWVGVSPKECEYLLSVICKMFKEHKIEPSPNNLLKLYTCK